MHAPPGSRHPSERDPRRDSLPARLFVSTLGLCSPPRSCRVLSIVRIAWCLQCEMYVSGGRDHDARKPDASTGSVHSGRRGELRRPDGSHVSAGSIEDAQDEGREDRVRGTGSRTLLRLLQIQINGKKRERYIELSSQLTSTRPTEDEISPNEPRASSPWVTSLHAYSTLHHTNKPPSLRSRPAPGPTEPNMRTSSMCPGHGRGRPPQPFLPDRPLLRTLS